MLRMLLLPNHPYETTPCDELITRYKPVSNPVWVETMVRYDLTVHDKNLGL